MPVALAIVAGSVHTFPVATFRHLGLQIHQNTFGEGYLLIDSPNRGWASNESIIIYRWAVVNLAL